MSGSSSTTSLSTVANAVCACRLNAAAVPTIARPRRRSYSIEWPAPDEEDPQAEVQGTQQVVQQHLTWCLGQRRGVDDDLPNRRNRLPLNAASCNASMMAGEAAARADPSPRNSSNTAAAVHRPNAT